MGSGGGILSAMFFSISLGFGQCQHSRKEEGREGIGKKEEKGGKEEEREGGKEGVRRPREKFCFCISF